MSGVCAVNLTMAIFMAAFTRLFLIGGLKSLTARIATKTAFVLHSQLQGMYPHFCIGCLRSIKPFQLQNVADGPDASSVQRLHEVLSSTVTLGTESASACCARVTIKNFDVTCSERTWALIDPHSSVIWTYIIYCKLRPSSIGQAHVRKRTQRSPPPRKFRRFRGRIACCTPTNHAVP